MNILSVDAGHGGATHDSFIWANHPLQAHLEELSNMENVWFLGKLPCLLLSINSMNDNMHVIVTPVSGLHCSQIPNLRNCYCGQSLDVR